MNRYEIAGRYALVRGPRYDLGKVLDACEELIGRIAEEFGGRLTLTTSHAEYARRFPWPEPARAVARETWMSMAEIYDAVDEALVHHADPIVVKAYLLGKTWCVWDRKTGTLATPRGEPISALDPEPMVCIYGPEENINRYRLAAAADIERVERLVTGELPRLRLRFEKTRPLPEAGRGGVVTMRQAAFVGFPHAEYGDGIGEIRVRCVGPDGEEVDPKDFLLH